MESRPEAAACTCSCATGDRHTPTCPDVLRNVLILNVPKARKDHTTVPVEVRILGPFEEFLVHWDPGRRKTRPCWNHDDCPHCKLDGADVRRVAYASAEVYEADSAGRRTAKLVALAVNEKQIPLAKALPIGTVVKLIRKGSGPGEKLTFELANKKPDPGAVNAPFCARTYMIRFWFKGRIPQEFNVNPPERLTAALPNLPLTPQLPFVESEESAERFLFEKFGTNTLAGVAAAIKERESAPVPATEATAVDPLAEQAQYRADEVKWHDGPAAAVARRAEVTAACQRAKIAPFATRYADERVKSKADYLTTAAMLESAGEPKAGKLLRDIASRRFDRPVTTPASCTAQLPEVRRAMEGLVPL
jgi:hypothetical protein